MLFEGPPGIGKSSLVRAITRYYLAPDLPFDAPAPLTEKANRDGLEESIFSLNAPDSSITLALVQSIQKEGNHWLFVDELNNGNPEHILPIVELFQKFKQNILPVLEINQIPLRVPHRFRLICALNPPTNRFSYDLDLRAKQRFRLITLQKPSHDQTRRVALAHSSLDEDKTYDIADLFYAINEYSPPNQWLGFRILIDVIHDLCHDTELPGQCTRGDKLHIDTVLESRLKNTLEEFSLEALERLVVNELSDYFKTVEILKILIEKKRRKRW